MELFSSPIWTEWLRPVLLITLPLMVVIIPIQWYLVYREWKQEIIFKAIALLLDWDYPCCPECGNKLTKDIGRDNEA